MDQALKALRAYWRNKNHGLTEELENACRQVSERLRTAAKANNYEAQNSLSDGELRTQLESLGKGGDGVIRRFLERTQVSKKGTSERPEVQLPSPKSTGDSYRNSFGTVHGGLRFGPQNYYGPTELAPSVDAEPDSERAKTESSWFNAPEPLLTPPGDLELRVHRVPSTTSEWQIELALQGAPVDPGPRSFEPFTLHPRTGEKIRGFLAQIDRARVPIGEWGSVPLVVQNFGSMLFDKILRKPLGEALWVSRDVRGALLVVSEEPWIPWEIVQLQQPHQRNGSERRGPFLCEAFNLLRWPPSAGHEDKEGRLHLSPPMTLPTKRIAVVAPQSAELRAQKPEVEFLLSLSPERQVKMIPAKEETIREHICSGNFDAWHFCGHGSLGDDPHLAGFPLDDGKFLTPQILAGNCGSFGDPQPLVFMNGCYSGRAGDSLVDIGGWPSAFLRAGAGAFIGSLWQISSEQAFDYMREFYTQWLTGATLASALHHAREQASGLADPTRLAYTAYGHPAASCTGRGKGTEATTYY